MIKYVRSMFGLEEPSKRTVLGNTSNTNIDIKDIEYIKESNTRLTALNYLVIRYKGTLHEPKIRAVLEKTRTIHQFLVNQKRVHELELFHLRNTDHFLNTFSVIMDVYQRNKDINFTPAPELKEETASQNGAPFLVALEKERRAKARPQKAPEMVRPLRVQGQTVHVKEAVTDAPKLTLPEISIDTYSRVVYFREGTVSCLVENEIGFSSSNEEKEAFLANVASRLGLNREHIEYVGNAIVNIPNNNGATPTGYVPIIHWQGFMYAINLNDYRLFPVKMYRKKR